MLNLNELVDTTYAQYKQEEAAVAAERAAASRAKADKALVEFRAALEAELGLDIIAALGITFRAFQTTQPSGIAEWVDEESDTAWTISTYYDLAVRWKIVAETNERASIEIFRHAASAGNLRDAILIGLGKAREWVTERREKEAERERAEQESQAFAARQAEQRAAEQAVERLADAEIRAELARLQATTPPLWTWKPDAVFTLYVLSYITGVGITDEGESVFDYAYAYTLTDTLDLAGYITTVSPTGERSEIKLSEQAHKPIWERLTCHSTDDLPAVLTVKQRASLRHVTGIYDYAESVCNPVRYAYTTDEDAEEVVIVGTLPVQWVRDLVAAR